MASFGSLGIQPYSGADAAIDQNFGQMQASAIQSLGAQVRSDIDQIMTTRAVRNMVPALSQLRPGTDDFPQQAAAVIAQNPLALRHPAGKAAIELLGNAHVQAQREQMLQQRLDNTTANLDTRLTAQERLQGERLRSQSDLTDRRLENQSTLQGERLQTQRDLQGDRLDLTKELSDRRAGEKETKEERLARELQVARERKSNRSGLSASHIKLAEDLGTKLIIVEKKLDEATENNGVTAEGERAEDLLKARHMLRQNIRKLNLNEQPGIPGLPQAGGAVAPEALIPTGAPGPQPPAGRLVRGPDGKFIFQ